MPQRPEHDHAHPKTPVTNKNSSFLSKFRRSDPNDQEQPMIQAKSLKPPNKRRFTNWWLWELLSWVVAASTLMAAIVILANYHGKLLSEWPFSFTLNSLISFFGTISKSAMLVSVTEALSQLKWNRFSRRQHDLVELQEYDNASRGPWGSSLLIISLRARTLASVGAGIIILGLAVDTFMQAVVTYVARPTQIHGQGILPRASGYFMHDNDSMGLQTIDLTMKAAIYNGIYSSDISSIDFSPSCDSGNCTWPKYSTLAISSQCADVTNHISQNCSDVTKCPARLPDGPLLHVFYYLNVTTYDMWGNQTLAFKNIPNRLLDFVTMYSPSSFNNASDVKAFECILYFTVNSYSGTTMTNGVLSENGTTWYPKEAFLDDASTWEFDSPSESSGTGEDSHFEIAASSLVGFWSIFPDLFNGTVYGSPASPPFYSSDTMQAFRSSAESLGRMQKLFTNLATSMTNNIREEGGANSTGTAWKTETYIHIRWQWLILPVSLLMLSLVFLIITMLVSNKQNIPVWKSSQLALLFHGLTPEYRAKTDHENANLDLITEMEDFAKKIRVKLMQTEDGVQFV
ncbi:MAG: hypothetical protein M1834_008238 [Cirrosporium novae-zelandiae]|nr:MAG: hypothetical protein M1834_008238 [Cirrosporium novae-zelandiae]